MPSPAKFHSGYLPSRVIPVSPAIPVGGNGGGSGSDMDLSSDSDDEVYGARYSLDTSPQDDKIYNGTGPKSTNSVVRKINYANDPVHSELSSSRDRIERKQGRCLEKLGDDESSVSVASSEATSTLFRSGNDSVGHQGRCSSAGYYPSVHSQPNVKTTAKQELFDDGVPSAPPFADSVQEINQVAEQISTFRGHGTPCSESSHAAMSSSSLPAQRPTFHASGLGPWCAVISYDACVRLCLYSWARGCVEAPIFLENESMLLRNAFGLQQVLLQPEDELLRKPSSELSSEGAAVKPKKTFGKMKVQVRKVKMAKDLPTGCSFSSLKPSMVKLESLRFHMSNAKSTISSAWGVIRTVRVAPRIPANSSFSRQSLAYMHAGTRYIKEVSGILKAGATTFRSSSSSYEVVQETYSCLLGLKSSSQEDAVRMQPGSSETHIFLPDGLGDDLIIEVHDSKGKHCGHVVAQVATIAEDPGKLRWWSIYQEPEHELVGRIQLYISYSTSPDENSHLKCGSVAETVAYDLVLEVAMKVQQVKQRNLLLHGPWKWLITEFASYYGVSDAYTKLRYLSYVMDVATPTADCLSLVHELLVPVVMKSNVKGALSHQEFLIGLRRFLLWFLRITSHLMNHHNQEWWIFSGLQLDWPHLLLNLL
ncbi:hypothetical protein CsSME_00002565 [Camellia sinensis var. sinensis]